MNGKNQIDAQKVSSCNDHLWSVYTGANSCTTWTMIIGLDMFPTQVSQFPKNGLVPAIYGRFSGFPRLRNPRKPWCKRSIIDLNRTPSEGVGVRAIAVLLLPACASHGVGVKCMSLVTYAAPSTRYPYLNSTRVKSKSQVASFTRTRVKPKPSVQWEKPVAQVWVSKARPVPVGPIPNIIRGCPASQGTFRFFCPPGFFFLLNPF